MSAAPSQTIAIDLGAESGRVMVATFDGELLSLEEAHRFPNGAVRLGGTLRWDLLAIYRGIIDGLRKVARQGVQAASLSVDSWAIDFALQRGAEPLLRPPYHYRDARNEAAFRRMRNPEFDEWVFGETGIQFMPINTLYQLLADEHEDAGLLAASDRLLLIADWVHFLLCGRAVAEETNASTTQLYNPLSRAWSEKLIERFNLPRKLFPVIVPPGTVLGPLLPEAQRATGLGPVRVIAGCTHDTAAAVAATPGEGNDWAYLSSGTWSLIGVELPAPLMSPAAREANFTNEVGYGGSIRFLKNIAGLWLLQECRRLWARDGREFDYATLADLARQAPPLRSLIQPNDPRFHSPEEMIAEIRGYCRESAQPEPESPGEFARCIFESLALLYAAKLCEIERLTARTIRVLHIVGGGSRNALLNQMAADATGRRVLAGPVEATALGNVLSQMLAPPTMESLATGRAIIRRSFDVSAYEPQSGPEWAAARERFTYLPAR